jgi:hypothetical protein
MVGSRTCKFRRENGQQCRATPLSDSDFCLWHDPEKADEVQEARRLGGQRRRRERIVSGAYDFEGLQSIVHIRRLLEVAVTDLLGLENSIARARTLAYIAQSATKLLEVGEFEERLQALEQVVEPRKNAPGGRRR